ncbi:hypothetical protein ACFO1B_32925 [Dactylosporangium siamense]|uniref:Uncharacterized protein n=1 Tax=Dactylosporangium siamense TaxID=685454 RepID=A0A919PM10_9ACTN|nr:hypothetical protein [Dactylosporangium siamense]GIG46249.1 hypothetical protein Dsi01nite_042900 [Dactylosporangium siamense]
MSIAGVTRELLVRYLDLWVPGAVHSPHGATFLQASATGLDGDIAEAALRAGAEFGDRLSRRRLTLLFVAPEVGDVQGRLDGVRRELRTPPELSVHVMPGSVAVMLKALGAHSGPLLSLIDGIDPAVVQVGKPAEVITVDVPREELRGFELTAAVTLVEGHDERTIGFGTRSAKSLEAFKNEMWALDEYAGVRYRDPNDPEGHLMDIALEPNPGALRRELLALLRTGGRTVTELKRFALTETVYRAADAVKVVTALLQSGAVTREPRDGRLGGDVTIRIAG